MTTCPLCRRPAEDRHLACRRAVDHDLERVPALYRLLGAALEPGQSASARVSGSRTPPIPARLEPLSLRGPGGIIATVATWETGWRELRALPAFASADHEQLLTSEQVLDSIVEFLRYHLDWAIDHHPDVHQFAQEIHQIVADCYRALGVRSDLMRVGPCPTPVDDTGATCGQTLYADPHLHTVHCTRCRTTWPMLDLGEKLADTHETKNAA